LPIIRGELPIIVRDPFALRAPERNRRPALKP
jgi:hypothetical protein